MPDVADSRTLRVAAPMAVVFMSPPGFEAMAREHHKALDAFALKLTGSPADARDLVQDTFERALRRFDAFTEGTNARAWLFAILHNAFIDRCRRRASEKRGPNVDEIQIEAAPASEPPRWASITAEQVTLAVSKLEPEFRAVYDLHARDGLAYQEIGARLGIPVNTVGTRLARARRKLRAMLEPAAAEEDGT